MAQYFGQTMVIMGKIWNRYGKIVHNILGKIYNYLGNFGKKLGQKKLGSGCEFFFIKLLVLLGIYQFLWLALIKDRKIWVIF